MQDDVPLPQHEEEASDLEDDDLEFVRQNAKRLGFLTSLDKKALDK